MENEKQKKRKKQTKGEGKRSAEIQTDQGMEESLQHNRKSKPHTQQSTQHAAGARFVARPLPLRSHIFFDVFWAIL